tara:strand:+ start:76 stop:795 length:720 start_codon:yes stop_codon:yes gene_type:complete
MMSLGIADANELMAALAKAPLSVTENTTGKGHSIMTTKGVHRLMADRYGVLDDNVSYYGWPYVNKESADTDHLWVMTQTIKSDDESTQHWLTLRKLFFVGWANGKSDKYPEGQWGASDKVLVALPEVKAGELIFQTHIVDFYDLESFLGDNHHQNIIALQGALPSQPPKMWRTDAWKDIVKGQLKEMAYVRQKYRAKWRQNAKFMTPSLKFYTVPWEPTNPPLRLLNWRIEQVKGLLNL